MRLYLLRFDSLTSQNSGTSVVGSLLASTHYGSCSYRAATGPAAYSFAQALLPLGCYWWARRAWVRATLVCCIILSHPTVGHICFPHPRSIDRKATPSSLPLIHWHLLPLSNSCHSSIGTCQPHPSTLSAVVQPLPRLTTSRLCYRRHQQTLPDTAVLHNTQPYFRTARLPSSCHSSLPSRSITR